MKGLTLSLEENLIQRGSSLMTFFTSFHEVVRVIYNMKEHLSVNDQHDPVG